ncbi:MAG: class I SAM-dependent methyltransferase [Kordiimonadaceae bacterium]|nr:class I SAM-dependent methyltransferase [Kordiimonadaceae bacterium]MBO6570479.1 class I SAM-dependent methyltransferase [Kordiimonadaceae bacterium]MBO6966402.1 class I SAM-dependent methyltransferase [Kordiimonadaceae bacterium]
MDGSYQSYDARQTNTKAAPLEKMFSAIMDNLSEGQLIVKFPSGAVRTFTGSQPGLAAGLIGEMHIHRWSAISRALKGGTMGLAESYMDAAWSSPDLTNLLRVLAANMDRLEARLKRSFLPRVWERIGHWINRNNKAGSRRNISFHYDLGNDFYSLWLDPSMTYSAALFDGTLRTLEDAQKAKYKAIAEAVGIQSGDHVLEIGCGWGGFAEYAAGELGCKITGVTLSKEQLTFAKARLAKAGLNDKTDLRLCDYRDLDGEFNHIVSIEMLEAVGEQFWPTYFEKLKSLLKPGGKAGIQVITIDNARFDGYRRGVDYIQKYIFPGGMLPSDSVLKKLFDDNGLSLKNQLDFGVDYGETLKRWHESYAAHWPTIQGMGYDEKFDRMWRFYLSYCEAGFRQKTIDVSQYVVG